MTKPTPGPWMLSCNPGSGRAQGVHSTAVSGPRSNIVNWGGLSRAASAEGQANARLIAAAPAMLAALLNCRCPANEMTVEQCMARAGGCRCDRGAAVAAAVGDRTDVAQPPISREPR